MLVERTLFVVVLLFFCLEMWVKRCQGQLTVEDADTATGDLWKMDC